MRTSDGTDTKEARDHIRKIGIFHQFIHRVLNLVVHAAEFHLQSFAISSMLRRYREVAKDLVSTDYQIAAFKEDSDVVDESPVVRAVVTVP